MLVRHRFVAVRLAAALRVALSALVLPAHRANCGRVRITVAAREYASRFLDVAGSGGDTQFNLTPKTDLRRRLRAQYGRVSSPAVK